MNKYIYFLLLLVSFLITNNAYATSGACSYHGGVDCSAGADWDGSVICNDGWQDSSVSYYSMLECKTSLPKCPRPYLYGATDRYTCDQYQNNCKKYQDSTRQFCLRSGRSESSCIELNPKLNSCPEAEECLKQVIANSAQIQASEQCWNDAIKSQKQRLETLETETQKLNQAILDTSCGSFSHYDSNYKKCFCNDGYAYSNGQCQNADFMCKKQMGIHSYVSVAHNPSSGANQYNCYCDNGYVQDSSGICQTIPKSKMDITQRVINWINSGHRDCEENDQKFSTEEVRACNAYKLLSNNYDWQIINSNNTQNITNTPQPTKPNLLPQPTITESKKEIKNNSTKIKDNTQGIRPTNLPETKSTLISNTIQTDNSSTTKPSQPIPPQYSLLNSISNLFNKLKFWK